MVKARTVPLFWRIFAVNAGLLALIALLLVVTPVTIHAPPTLTEVLLIVAGLAITVAANALLLRRAVAPLVRLAQRMDTVDLLRPGQRLRVGRDDEVGQLLTGVLLELNSIAEAAPRHRRELDGTEEAVRRALDEVRRISSELRPEMLEQLGLVSALTELTTTFGRVSGIDVERDFDPSLPKLAPETELAVYRIAQESLTNIGRHSNASRVTIALGRGPDSIVLSVGDDGRGFDGSMPEEHGGLRSMRERALLVGGALAIKESPRGGVEVRLEVPTAPVDEPVGVKS